MSELETKKTLVAWKIDLITIMAQIAQTREIITELMEKADHLKVEEEFIRRKIKNYAE